MPPTGSWEATKRQTGRVLTGCGVDEDPPQCLREHQKTKVQGWEIKIGRTHGFERGVNGRSLSTKDDLLNREKTALRVGVMCTHSGKKKIGLNQGA